MLGLSLSAKKKNASSGSGEHWYGRRPGNTTVQKDILAKQPRRCHATPGEICRNLPKSEDKRDYVI